MRENEVRSKMVIYVIEVNLDTSKVSHRKIKFMWENVYMYTYMNC